MAIGKKIIETLCPSCGFRCRAPVLYIGKSIVCPRCRTGFNAVKFNYSSLLKNFIRIAMGNFLITEEKLGEMALEQKKFKESGRAQPLEDLLIDHGLITTDQKNRLMASSVRKLNRMFVAIAVEKGVISKASGTKALELQAADFKEDKLTLVCDILLEQRDLSKEDADRMIEEIENGENDGLKRKDRILSDQSGQYPLMGKVALEKQMVTLSQLEEALLFQKKRKGEGESAALEDIFHELGMISAETRQKLVLKTLKKIDKELGKIALLSNLVATERMVVAIGRQAALFKQFYYFPLFHILQKDGALTRQGVEDAWSRFKEITRDEAEAMVKKGASILSQIAQIRRGNLSPSSTWHIESSADRSHDESEILFTVSEDRLTLSIAIHPAVGKDATESAEGFLKDIKALLAEKGIVFGVFNDEILGRSIKAAILTHEPFLAAQGEPPKDGRPAEIITYFQTDYLRAGTITEAGVIDFKDRGDVPFVKKGDLLCLLIPALPSKEGIDIHGEPILAKTIEDIRLTCGSGVFLSDDGLKLFAGEDGRPERTIDGKISVYPELTIPGDVDFSTGNIAFEGNIHVKGAIARGFRVEGVNLKAKEILGGVVDVKGSVDVSGGIVDSDITSDGYVQAMYIKGTRVNAMGDLLIVKEIIDSSVELSGMLKCGRCKIIASSISARMGVVVNQIGTEVSTPCRIRVGVDDHLRSMIKKKEAQVHAIRGKIEKTQKSVEQFREELGALHQKVMEESIYQESLEADATRLCRKMGKAPSSSVLRKMKSAEVSVKKSMERSRDTVARHFTEQDLLLEKILSGISSVEEGIHTIESMGEIIQGLKKKETESQGDPVASIKNRIFAKTRVSGKRATIILAEDLKNVTIREVRKPSSEGEERDRWEMEVIRGR